MFLSERRMPLFQWTWWHKCVYCTFSLLWNPLHDLNRGILSKGCSPQGYVTLEERFCQLIFVTIFMTKGQYLILSTDCVVYMHMFWFVLEHQREKETGWDGNTRHSDQLLHTQDPSQRQSQAEGPSQPSPSAVAVHPLPVQHQRVSGGNEPREKLQRQFWSCCRQWRRWCYCEDRKWLWREWKQKWKICMHARTSAHVHIHICIQIHVRADTHTHTHTHTQARIHTWSCTHTNTHTRTHAHAHTCLTAKYESIYYPTDICKVTVEHKRCIAVDFFKVTVSSHTVLYIWPV